MRLAAFIVSKSNVLKCIGKLPHCSINHHFYFSPSHGHANSSRYISVSKEVKKISRRRTSASDRRSKEIEEHVKNFDPNRAPTQEIGEDFELLEDDQRLIDKYKDMDDLEDDTSESVDYKKYLVREHFGTVELPRSLISAIQKTLKGCFIYSVHCDLY
jgi:hypothetical protein